jgi:hypothetical protein
MVLDGRYASLSTNTLCTIQHKTNGCAIIPPAKSEKSATLTQVFVNNASGLVVGLLNACEFRITKTTS